MFELIGTQVTGGVVVWENVNVRGIEGRDRPGVILRDPLTKDSQRRDLKVLPGDDGVDLPLADDDRLILLKQMLTIEVARLIEPCVVVVLGRRILDVVSTGQTDQFAVVTADREDQAPTVLVAS